VDPIPFLSLAFQHEQTRKEIDNTLREVFFGNRFILGDRLSAFESEYASFSGTNYCVGVGNGLDALTLALKSLKLNAEDEVIVPAHTYIATWLAVTRSNARIVPIDAEPNTFNIDVRLIESQIGSKTRVILPVHIYGQPCDMTTIGLLANKYKLFIVEDNAQGHGSSWLEKLTGSFGIVNATSFYPTKNLGALGDAGAVTTDSLEKAEFVRRNRNYGMAVKDYVEDIGMNSRLDEMQAAVLSVKLPVVARWNLIRREIAASYLKNLKDVGDLVLPLSDKEALHVYHLFVIRTQFRDRLREFLSLNGVETLIHYPIPPHLQPVYKELGYGKGSFPIAEQIARTALSLPLWPGMTDGQVTYVIETIRRFFG
jgi:dTDP-4-amino-4,6-dideoxygalactose transaminase